MKKTVKTIIILIIKIAVIIFAFLFAKYCNNFVSYPFSIVLILNIIMFLSFSNYLLPFLLLFINKKIMYNKYKDGEVTFDYFRDVVTNYSLGALSCCTGNRINYKDQIISMLLKMDLEQKVELEKDYIIIKDPAKFTWIEKKVVDGINEGDILKNRKLKKLIKENNKYEFRHSSLSEPKSKNMKKITDFRMYGLFEMLLFIYAYINIILIFGNPGTKILTVYAIIFGIILILNLVIYIYIHNYNNYFLSKTGYEVKKKLIGLKNYLNDFGSLETIDSVNVWDYYIIYAILFNQKGKLNAEASKLYRKYLNNYI